MNEQASLLLSGTLVDLCVEVSHLYPELSHPILEESGNVGPRPSVEEVDLSSVEEVDLSL